jgi:hypothetical protein
MPSIDDVVQRIVTDVAGVTGIRRAHPYPVDSINQTLQAVVYPSALEWSWGETFGKKSVVFDVTIELYATAADEARLVEALVPFCDDIPAALYADEFLNAQVVQWTTIVGGIMRREDTGQMLLRLTVAQVHVEADL